MVRIRSNGVGAGLKPALKTNRPYRASSLQNNRHRAVVYERHVHHGPEAARLDLLDARCAEALAEVVEETRGLLG